MILPNVRASFGASDVGTLLAALERSTRRSRDSWEGQLAAEGLDALLDHPQALPAIMEGGGVGGARSRLAFYVMVRHALLECGLEDPAVADYLAALLIEFAMGARAFRIARYDDKTYRYLVDLMSDLEEESSDRRQFLLLAHLGNYSLWLSGLFPDYVVARLHRRGAPGLEYYEGLGATGYRMASEFELAGRYDLASIYVEVAGEFRAVRHALNRISDRYFFRPPTASIDRLLRQVIDEADFS